MTRRVPTMCVTWVKLRSELRGALRSRSTPTCSNEGGRPLGRARAPMAARPRGGWQREGSKGVVRCRRASHSRFAEMSEVLPQAKLPEEQRKPKHWLGLGLGLGSVVRGRVRGRARARVRVVHEHRENRHDRHILGDAVLQAADGRGHVGAVPLAPSAVSGEDAVDSLARVALGVLAGLRGGKDEGRGWRGWCDR